MRMFLLGLRQQEPGSTAGQLPSLLITSASSFLGQACSNFHRGRQKASEPGNQSVQKCLWGTLTGQPGPQNPNTFQVPCARGRYTTVPHGQLMSPHQTPHQPVTALLIISANAAAEATEIFAQGKKVVYFPEKNESLS